MPTPGLLYVNSTITRPETLTPETFTAWYNEEHIPDIFKTSGMKSAFRYRSTNPTDPRPYLAIYPLQDLAFLQTAEFMSIPVHSERFLPKNADGGLGGIFEYADFDTRYYELVETVGGGRDGGGGGGGGGDGEVKHLYVICADTATTISSLAKDPLFHRVRHCRLTFARQNRLPSEEKKLPQPPKYCSLYEFTSKPGQSLERAVKGLEGEEEGEGENEMKMDGPVEMKEFTLLKSFSAR